MAFQVPWYVSWIGCACGCFSGVLGFGCGRDAVGVLALIYDIILIGNIKSVRYDIRLQTVLLFWAEWYIWYSRQ